MVHPGLNFSLGHVILPGRLGDCRLPSIDLIEAYVAVQRLTSGSCIMMQSILSAPIPYAVTQGVLKCLV